MSIHYRKFIWLHLATLFISTLFLNSTVCAQFDQNPLLIAAKRLKDEKKSLVVLYPEGSLANIQPVAEIFSELTGVKISFSKMSVDDINTKMLLSAAQKISDYDIALPATFGIPDLAEAGALLDVSAYAAKYEPMVNYSPSLYQLGDSYKGKKYGYQTDGDTYVMFYNQVWLQDQNLQEQFKEKYHRALAVPQSWRELDQLMAFFHRPKNKMYGGCLFRIPRYMVWEWWIRFHAKGSYPFKDDMEPNIASKGGIEALEELIQASNYLHPSVKTNGLFDNWTEYAKGQCFANIGWGGTQKYLNSSKSALKGKLKHAPTPEVSYFNWGWNYVVSRHSKQAELAYLFTLFATLPKVSVIAVREEGFFDPYRSEHYHDEEIIKTYTHSFLMAHRQTMKQAIPDFYMEGQGRYIQALQEAIVAAYEGDVSAKEALDYASSRWQSITRDIGPAKQKEQWLELKQKYPRSFSE